jgi:DNA-binding NarL/FixJ family response regulator
VDSSDEAIEAIRVYILDGHVVARRRLRELLEDQGMVVVGESGTAAEAAARISALRPQVAVLDERPAGGPGIDVCWRIRGPGHQVSDPGGGPRRSGVPERGPRRGVRYLLKQLSGQDIAVAVRRVAAGEELFDPREEEGILSGG